MRLLESSQIHSGQARHAVRASDFIKGQADAHVHAHAISMNIGAIVILGSLIFSGVGLL
jgi:hypothetical protein